MFNEIIWFTRIKHGFNQQVIDQPKIHYLAPSGENQTPKANQDILFMFSVILKLQNQELIPDDGQLNWTTGLENNKLVEDAMDLLKNKNKLERKALEKRRASTFQSSAPIQTEPPVEQDFNAPPGKAPSATNRIGRFIPYKYRKRGDFCEETLIKLCNILEMKNPSISELNIHSVKEEDIKTQNEIFQNGYEDLTSQFGRLCSRLYQITNLKLTDLKSIVAQKQLRIEVLEREVDEKRLRIQKLEFESDRKIIQRKRRNKLREIRKIRAQESNGTSRFSPLN